MTPVSTRSRQVAGLAAAMCVVAITTPALAQPVPEPPPLPDHITADPPPPGSDTAEEPMSRLPGWVKAGTRFVYRVGPATIRENKAGWVSFDEADIADAKLPSWSYNDVLAVVDQQALVVTSTFQDAGDGRYMLASTNHTLMSPVAFGALAIKPKYLEPIGEGLAAEEIGTSSAETWTINGRAWDTRVTQTADTMKVIDTASGVVLAVTKEVDDGRGGKRGVAMRYVRYEQAPAPWAKAPRPGWIAAGQTLVFRTETWLVSRDAFTGQMTETPRVPSDMSIEIEKLHPTHADIKVSWAAVPGAMIKPDPRPATKRPSPNNGDYWINPDVLAKLKPGQVLSKLPEVGSTMTVKGRDRTPDGGEAVVLESASKSTTTTLAYDLKSGVIVHWHQVNHVTNVHIRYYFVTLKEP